MILSVAELRFKGPQGARVSETPSTAHPSLQPYRQGHMGPETRWDAHTQAGLPAASICLSDLGTCSCGHRSAGGPHLAPASLYLGPPTPPSRPTAPALLLRLHLPSCHAWSPSHLFNFYRPAPPSRSFSVPFQPTPSLNPQCNPAQVESHARAPLRGNGASGTETLAPAGVRWCDSPHHPQPCPRPKQQFQ